MAGILSLKSLQISQYLLNSFIAQILARYQVSHVDQNSTDLMIFHLSDFLMNRGMLFANYTGH